MVSSVTNNANLPTAAPNTAAPAGVATTIGLKAKSAFETAFGVTRPTAAKLNGSLTQSTTGLQAKSSKQYVSMTTSAAGDVFAKTAAPSKPYFSSQSMRAQFSGFALQALQQQRQQAFKSSKTNAAPQFGKQADTPKQTAPSILYQFSPQTEGNKSARSNLPYQVGVRVKALNMAPQFGNQPSDTADKLSYRVEPMVYRNYNMPAGSTGRLRANRLNNVPHILHDAIPTTANAVQFASGDVRLMADLPAAPTATTPAWMKTTQRYAQKAIQFAGKHMPSLSKYVGYDTNSHTLRVGNAEVSLQRFSARLGDDTTQSVAATPIHLLKTDTGYATLHSPVGFGDNVNTTALGGVTHNRLSQSRAHVEQLASQLGNGSYLGTHYMRQSDATLMTTPATPVPATHLGVNPFTSIGFAGNNKTTQKKETQ